ncbi:hemolysin III family protein [Mumia sp. zg.B53]|uniref:PAQR family membrane homeostasis protein TrhA n=1 Tax=unclassified Mumia TaxID=2621872 RepID=UPI001C6E4223|nr:MULTISPECIES: hemolysin III family protein [unclassified Mumia]MBW9206868.1 hemolysin III family protein [Mumia sp. zg.B17]MBW9210845.1 hemolysin III family protein [Mumia sp. zg.B21]MBW9215410.1 hemolysin III family protein [Mumia sp. zg.B53]MDD9350117.1 hemolysin III family protein [Mumia sp.]
MTEHERHPGAIDVGDRLRDAVDEIKPRLRGWLHAATWPLALVAFVVLLVLAPGARPKTGVAVYMASALLLFGVSAVYHLGRWGPRAEVLLKRLDHANIFLLIAGSYTPFALILLEPREAALLLTLVWTGAIGGVLFRVLWVHAPRWLYTPIYVLLGWAALFWLEDFAAASSTAVLVLIIVGGALYSLGALVYGLRYPDPYPRWFGFHEVFHSLTIAAFVVHYIGVSLAAYSV